VSAGRWMVMVAAAAALGVGVPAEAFARARRTVVKVSGSLNLATATVAQLDQLPGIGEKAARAIVDYRGKTPFTRVEELVRVKGFGKKRFDQLKPFLTLSGATTLKVERIPAQGSARPRER
jgi:competence protein ComEA